MSVSGNLKSQLEKRKKAASHISTIAGILRDDLDLVLDSEILKEVEKKLLEDRFQVLVMGEFSTGKSTFLNALLGEQALPMKTTPATAIITKIKYSASPSVDIFYRNGDKKKMSIEEFKNSFQLDDTDTDSADRIVTDRFVDISYAELSYPLELCKNNVELIDSPGLNDSSVRTRTTYQFLPKADAIIFLSSALQFYSEKESSYIEETLKPRGLKNIFFGITKWDLISTSSLEPEKERKDIIERARKVLLPFYIVNGVNLFNRRVHAIDSFNALKAKYKKPVDSVLYAQSGVESFETELKLFLEKEKGEVLLKRSYSEANNGVKLGKKKISEALAAYEQEVEVLKEKALQQRPLLERMTRIASDAEERIENEINTQQQKVVVSLFKFTDDLKKRIPTDIEEFETTQRIGIRSLLFNRKSLESGYTSDFEEYFNQEYSDWGDSISEEMKFSFEKLDNSLGRDVKEFLGLSYQITSNFSGKPTIQLGVEAKDEEEGAFKKLAATGIGILTLDPSGILAGAMGVGGWSAIFGRVVKDLLIFNALAVFLSGGTLAIAYLVSKAVQSIFDVNSKKNQISSIVANKVADELPDKIRSQEHDIKESVRDVFAEYKEKVMEVLKSKIEEHETFMSEIIKEMEDQDFDIRSKNMHLYDVQSRLEAELLEVDKSTK